ncbi:DUF2188 domain-containing protein [Macrococcus brunensis]|uniref:DUF2188 domain-containing protein n=1 Tax=Macrococcus brunensis TaxID=198483 RepID=A0A4R6BBF7_9STAP|nr:DUF2188 domain-containing protein [Macrococcus brunensis]TDL94308.1 DUF2188 domain-containing protein [Macrococcus brunensis]ULG75211.1 DUF2188 domain-containing protein [Macrococcus brunensis]
MMWTMNDYPNSWKNFDELERKKAIDIGNAMLTDGYKEEDLIPIATKQAKDWYKAASTEELHELKNKKITQHKKDDSAHPELMDKDVEVYFEDNKWHVKTQGAQRADSTHDTKQEAAKRAKEIADNKDVKVIQHQKND